jgi:hypothetical protein
MIWSYRRVPLNQKQSAEILIIFLGIFTSGPREETRL